MKLPACLEILHMKAINDFPVDYIIQTLSINQNALIYAGTYFKFHMQTKVMQLYHCFVIGAFPRSENYNNYILTKESSPKTISMYVR